jgi:hypothetical protein
MSRDLVKYQPVTLSARREVARVRRQAEVQRVRDLAAAALVTKRIDDAYDSFDHWVSRRMITETRVAESVADNLGLTMAVRSVLKIVDTGVGLYFTDLMRP